MMRDSKLSRRNSGKNLNFEETENVPVNVNIREPSVRRMSFDSCSRPPFNSISEPFQNPSKPAQESKSSKPHRTPTKAKMRYQESAMPMRTPEKQGVLARDRFGWGHDSTLNTPKSCRTPGRASLGFSELNSTHTTPTKTVTKPPNPGLIHGFNSRPPVRTGNFAALSKGIPVTSNTCTPVNTIEVPHFDLEEDPSFWMDHNVQVLIRIRPLNGMEITSQGYNRCLKQESAQCLTWVGNPETRFTFDHVACETIDQETLFKMVGQPMVENCLSGYNSCMFAYGQTGSGKTHTMLGEINNLEIKPSQYRGMTPRIFEFLFSRITAEEGSRKNERLTYNCKCSFLEIYNEQITDLLDPSSTNLQLREDVKKGVYVENLTEFEVHSVGDILRLLSQGSANRRVASTNMNRESSRSHSVFTCVIESRWEKDSTSNLRFARLNLVDLAGSERQKSSGAEGERLKEAANINKSLSTLGHVIMVLVDGANARTRHVPYRDSRLTFLLQDSLGGNSKTMIIANVSPSISSAIETLNTLKFAQRAKLIQNNAVINEDASGDVEALQRQIRLLKEELATLKRHNISRSLIFNSKNDNCSNESSLDNYEDDEKLLRVSCKQLKSLETSLNGALRREQSTENCIKQLEAEIEQLNSLVRQREEENRCTKMMLKFREDKIQRMESLLSGTLTVDSYLLQENKMVNEENKILRGKVDRNPEVTRFAVENIRLLEQLRRFQEFYEEGEREMLLSEVNELRNQLVFLDENLKKDDCVNTSFEKEVTEDKKEDDFLQLELKKSQEELEKCRDNLNSCMEKNEKLCKEIADLNDLLDLQKSAMHEQDGGIEVIKEPILEAPTIDDDSVHKVENNNEILAKNTKEVLDLQLEVEILKIILKEERLTRGETEEKFLLTTKQFENQKEELQEAKSVIEALDIQNLTSTNNLEDLKNTNNQYAEILLEKDLEIGSLKDQISSQELQDSASISNHLETKLRKMQESLEKAKRLNDLYQNDLSFHAFNEEQMDKVRKQVEIETTDVIVCLQEELFSFQQKMDESCLKEKNTQQEFIILKEKLDVMTECNNRLQEKCEESDTQQQELVILKERLDVLTECNNRLQEKCEESDTQQLVILKEKLDVLTECNNRLQKKCEESDTQQEELVILKERLDILTECNNRLQEKCEESDTQQLVILKEKLDVLTECSKTLREKCAEKDKDIEGVLNAEIFLEVLKEELQEAKSVINAVEIQNLVSINHFEDLKNSNKKYAEILHEKDLEIDSLKFQISSQESQYPQKDLIILQEKLDAMTECNKSLREKCEERDTYQQELIIMKEELNVMTECNKRLQEKCEEKDQELNGLSDKIEGVLNGEMFQEILKEKLQEATSVINALEIQTLVSNNNLEDLKNSNKKFAGILHGKDFEITSLKDQISSQDLTNLKEELDVMTECNKRLTEKCEEKDKELFILSEEIEEVLNGGHVAIDDAMNYRHEKRECVSEKLQIISRNINEKELKIKELNSYLEDAKSKGIEMESMLRSLRGATLVISEAHQQDCIKKDQEISQLLSQIDKLKENLIEKDSAIEEAEKKIQSLEIESCCYFDRIKEADFMITELKKKVESYSILEEQFKKDTIEMMEEVKEIESMILEIKAKNQELVPKGSDFYDIIKACFHDLLTWHEEIWFEMIEKDWVVSVFHVCHMEKLMETVSGLNVEKGLLLNGLCESNSLVSELKGQNGKSRKELEAFSMLRWKLLVDIKNGFDRISRKEEETGKISMRVNNFEKKILELQVLEETMLENFNHMGHELFVLMKEMDMSNEKDEEKLVMDLYAKEIKLLIISSKVKEVISINNDIEIQKSRMLMVIEKFKEDKIVSFVDMQLKDWILMEKDSKIGDLKQEVEMQKEVLKIYSKHELEMENLELKSVVDEKNNLIESLKEDLKSVSCEKDEINGKILAKEEELKVYEKSVEELECTVNVLENQVEMVKGDAERQRLQREEIELELHDLEQQVHNDSDMKRELDEKEKEIQDLLRRNIILEKEITELNQQKVQDKEYNQTTFKSMESTDDVSVTSSPYNILNSPLKRLDKSGTRSRGGGSCSPFKLAQQLKFEKNGEIFSARIRIEELEKEMVMLNAKNDELNEKIRIHDVDSQVKLNQQLDEFVVERQRSQDEIKRLQVALEQIDQQEQLLKTENEIFKTEIDNLKKNVMELEVAGQQNLQQQILHHAKIKEENNVLKAQNGEIGQKLKRAEVIIRRVKEELANLRETSARNPC